MSKESKVYKECTKCAQIKEITEFYRSNRSWCKECDRKAARFRMGRPKNKIRTVHRDARKAAKRFGAYDDLTQEDVFYVFSIMGNRCAYCGKLSQKLELDHVIPLSRGGGNTISNVTISCEVCNRKKHTDDLLRFLLLNIQDESLIVSTIERIAFRADISSLEVIERLKEQYFDYSYEDAVKEYEKYMEKEAKNDDE